MSDIEWSPWIKHDGDEECPEGIEGLPSCIKQKGYPEKVFGEIGNGLGGGWLWEPVTHYRIPMADYRRITGMPDWSEAPEWATHAAQNGDGQWFFLKGPVEPAPETDSRWFICKKAGSQAGRGTVLGDWRDTLQERPRDPLDSHPDSEPEEDRYSVGADTFPQDARDELLKRAQASNLNPYDAPGFLEAALGHMEDRKTTYDAPEGERSMGKTVASFNAITGRDISEEEGWLFMVLLKAVRTQQGAFRADNYEDGAAYFALQGEAAARDRGHE